MKTKKTAEDIKKIDIERAKSLYDAMPFVTKVYLTLQLKVPYQFISDNWEEITGIKPS